MVEYTAPVVYVEESATATPIEGVDTSTAGMIGLTERGPVAAHLVTSFSEFAQVFGEPVADPSPQLRAQWTLDTVGGGQWWQLALAVKGYFENGGKRLYIKRVPCADVGSLTAADFVAAIDAFEDIDAVSILAAPGMWAKAVHAALITRCEARGRCFAILDSAAGLSVDGVRDFRLDLRSSFAALYFPWLETLDPRTTQRVATPPSGHIAGVYSRVDAERGVFKAPAGETLRGAEALARQLTRAEADVLNRDGIDTLRSFAGAGIRVWGARTLADGDWKYVNVRRLLIYIEHSIEDGLQWVVFEPNGEALWASVRRSVSDFLLSLWQAGGLAGSKPEQAFFVRCDRTTMTQDDLDQGRLVCEIGVAPVRPAEFVIVRIGQWTADHDASHDTDGDDADAADGPPYVAFDYVVGRGEPTSGGAGGDGGAGGSGSEDPDASEADRRVLDEVLDRATRRGALVMVTGKGKDGKAAVAAAMASASRLPLYRIDLSGVVSKYIGETERNLDRIFAAADEGGAVLFFDEADALFGRRSEVQGGSDRYADTEVSFLLQRIDAHRGLVIVAACRRSAVPRRLLRVALCGVEVPPTFGTVEMSLPDLSSAVDREVQSQNLRIVEAIYFAAMLEDLDLFRVVDKVVELFAAGLLPLGGNDGASLLSRYAGEGGHRLSESERRDLYGQVLGVPGGSDGPAPNREFDALWVRFLAAVASLSTRDDPAVQSALRAAARDLQDDLSLHGRGLSLYAANELGEQMRDALAILGDAEVQGAFGARDMWQVIDRVATGELGGARNRTRYATMATVGAVVIAWLATHLDRLAQTATRPMLDAPAAASSLGTTALSQPGDGDLSSVCAAWIAVSQDPVNGLDDPTPPAELPDAIRASIDLPSRARDLLCSLGVGPTGHGAVRCA